MAATAERPVGVILCGGLASRLGGDKARKLLAGKHLVQHVVERLEDQVSCVYLSAQQDTALPDGLFAQRIPDRVQSHRGPLAGLYSALEFLDNDNEPRNLLLCPCDAPFLPPDLCDKLTAALEGGTAPVAVARYQGVAQPTFSLWRCAAVLPVVRDTVCETGAGGLMHMLDLLPHQLVDWPVSAIPPFFNINTSADLAEAERMLDAAGACG